MEKGNAVFKKRNVSKYGLAILTLAVVAVFTCLNGDFLRPSNLSSIAVTNVVGGVVSLGAFFILTTSEFDLSIGYNIMVSLCLGAVLIDKGVPSPLVIACMILCGTLLGLVNGLVAVNLGVTPFIATLSTGLMMYSVAQIITGGTTLRIAMPKAWNAFSQGSIFHIPYGLIFWIALCLVVWVFVCHTALGRSFSAVGFSRKTAYLAGIRVNLVRRLAYTLAGFFASLAAVIYLGQVNSGSVQYGPSFLMTAYSCVFLSTTAFKIGTPNIWGVVLAIFFIGFGSNGIAILGAPSWIPYVYEGLILIFAILMMNALREKTREELDEA